MKQYITPSIKELGAVQDLTLAGDYFGAPDGVIYIIGTTVEGRNQVLAGLSGPPLGFPRAR